MLPSIISENDKCAVLYNQGDQIGQFLSNWATFGGALQFFEKKWWHFGLLFGFYYIFSQISSFKTWFLYVFYGFKSGLLYIFWTFKLRFVVDILAYFWLGDCFGYFLINWAIFLICRSPWANVIKLLSLIYVFLYQARVFVRIGWKCLPSKNILAYCEN